MEQLFSPLPRPDILERRIAALVGEVHFGDNSPIFWIWPHNSIQMYGRQRLDVSTDLRNTILECNHHMSAHNPDEGSFASDMIALYCKGFTPGGAARDIPIFQSQLSRSQIEAASLHHGFLTLLFLLHWMKVPKLEKCARQCWDNIRQLSKTSLKEDTHYTDV